MKNRIISFLMSCMLILIPLVSGCSPKNDSDESDRSTKTAEREKVTNVFKTTAVSFPENYLVVSKSIAFSNDRIYVIGYEQTEDSEIEDYDISQRHNIIISYNADGEDMQIEEAPFGEIDKFKILSDGSRIFFLSKYNSETMQNEFWINKTDSSRNEIFSVNVSEMFFDISKAYDIIHMGDTYMQIDNEDRIYIWAKMYADSLVIVINSDTGEKLFHIITPQSIRNVLMVGGKMAIHYYDSELLFKYIDTDTQKLGDNVYIPGKVNFGVCTLYSGYTEDTSGILYYYTTPTGMYGVGENEPVSAEIINWMNSDINATKIYSMQILSNDKLVYPRYNATSFTSDAIMILTRIPDDEVVPKYVIEVGYVGTGTQSDMIELATIFNQENENYRVRFVDYNQLSGGLYDDELNLFINTQIASGNIPDIFYLSSNHMSGKNYEDKSLFLDLYEYLNNDTELTGDDFLKCVLSTGEVDGKLYYLLTSFYVRTLVGKTENIGDEKGWSISEFLDRAENLPDGVKIISDETRENVYNSLVKPGLIEFIDSESGTCSFSSDLFLRLLDYLGGLHKNSDSYYDSDTSAKEYRENISLLEDVRIYNFFEYLKLSVNFGTEDLTFVGFPGVGDKIQSTYSYAISSKSEKEIRDGAWEFLRYMILSESEQDTNSMFLLSSFEKTFSSTYSSFSKHAEEEMEYYYNIGPEGNMSGRNWEYTQDELNELGGTLVHLTQDDEDEILDYLESIERSDTVDSKIYEIIDEEMQYFFADAKTAEETANLIQSRVSIYLSEMN